MALSLGDGAVRRVDHEVEDAVPREHLAHCRYLHDPSLRWPISRVCVNEPQVGIGTGDLENLAHVGRPQSDERQVLALRKAPKLCVCLEPEPGP